MNREKVPAREISRIISNGELSCEEHIASLLDRINKINPRLRAYLTINEHAIDQAKEIDAKIHRKEKLGRLAGIGIAVKDNICTKGIKTTCASNILSGYIPPYDATVIERIKHEDGIILGKTNMDEFGMGNTTENSHFGPTRNPVNEDLVPGGSSGGSAAAVFAEICGMALGSDTGGSIRCPASFCSVVGLKPTYGSVSRFGLVAYANSLEQIGPIARDSLDCECLFEVISGHDTRDATSEPRNKSSERPRELKGLKIGVPKQLISTIQPGVMKEFQRAVSSIRAGGVQVVEFSMNYIDLAVAVYYIIAMGEASSNLARYDGMRYGSSSGRRGIDWERTISNTRTEGFGSEVKRRILLGTFVLSAGYIDQYYVRAQKIRGVLKEEFDKAFAKFDYLIAPTMPTLPFKLGEKADPLELYQMDCNTVPANLAGIPAISIPCGSSDSIPVGLQIMAPRFNDFALLRIASLIEGLARS